MNAHRIAADPTGLATVVAGLRDAAGTTSFPCAPSAPTGDAAADAAVREFDVRWSACLRVLGEVAERTARQTDLTALAFRLAGG
ncbi:hypothetical protein [Streptosporangium carneum]|uniref:Uncharacterized protein n=1 Tax=Streptosporangium carneum TaxID=47481 RepID=A0A9W6I525_9ACTN|nr:hypothetical protein [Streptosporangium carneum]GLK11838.1 hypothetical protein GCM10017600_52460 [Streptosporangium carneum]